MKFNTIFDFLKYWIKFLKSDGFFHIFTGSILNKAFTFVSSIVVVRLITKSEYGYLTFVDNLYSYVGLFTGLGMSTAIMKFCNPYSDKNEDRYYLSFSLKYGSLIQLLLSFFLILYVSNVSFTFPKARPLLLLKFFSPCSIFILTLVQNYLRSQGLNKSFSYISITQTIVTLISSIVFALIFSVYGVIIARYIGIALALYISSKLLKQLLHETRRITVSREHINKYLNMSVAIMIADIFATIITLDETFLVSKIFRDEVLTASYKVAIIFPSQLLFISNAIVVYAFPKISQEKSAKKAFEKILKVEFCCLIIITILAFLGYVVNPNLINIVYGSSYNDSISLSNLYWITFWINSGFRIIPIQMLAATGQAKSNAFISAATALIHFFLFSYAIKEWGINASAFATGIVYVFSATISWFVLYKSQKYNFNK